MKAKNRGGKWEKEQTWTAAQSDLRSHPCWRMLSRLTAGLALCMAASELDRDLLWQRSSSVSTCFLCSGTKALCETGPRSGCASSLPSWAHSSASWLLFSVREALDSFPEVCSVRKDKCQLHHWHFGWSTHILKKAFYCCCKEMNSFRVIFGQLYCDTREFFFYWNQKCFRMWC